MFNNSYQARPFPVRVSALQNKCDPYSSAVWGDLDDPVTRDEIEKAIKESRTQEPDPEIYNEDLPCSRQKHIERIAWLVVNDWNKPINIDVGVPSLGCYPSWLIKDGNHRFAAAIYREDEFIYAYVDGSIAYMNEILS